jgi:hypothetical protein
MSHVNVPADTIEAAERRHQPSDGRATATMVASQDIDFDSLPEDEKAFILELERRRAIAQQCRRVIE